MDPTETTKPGREPGTWRRWLAGVAALVLLGGAAFLVYAWHPALPEIEPPASTSFTPQQIERGRVLAAAGYCTNCHTAAGGAPFAGNYRMATPFGDVYSSNITPDPDTGIGRWSSAAFVRSMREGVDREGRHLLPAFPYEHFNKMTDEDLQALYAFLMAGVAPVREAKHANTIPFPLNLRILQAGWKLLMADTKPFAPRADKPAEWNRGAYLVQGVSHCGACHTPRNALGGEVRSRMYEGAEIDGWWAPSLTTSNPSPIRWRAQDLYEYLRTGNSPYHGSAAGPMAEVVHEGMSQLPDVDVRAIAAYLGDLAGNVQDDPARSPALKAALARQKAIPDERIDHGARLYAVACAACHYSPDTMLKGRPYLPIGSAVNQDIPDNLLRAMLDGVPAKDGLQGIVMPAFGTSLSDNDVAAIAAYLRSQSGQPPWPDLAQRIAKLRTGAHPAAAENKRRNDP